MADETIEGGEPAPARPAAPLRPAIALVANLVLPPLGHVYAGALRRGLVLWAATRALVAASLVPVVASPGLVAVILVPLVSLGSAIALALDGWRSARRRGAPGSPAARPPWTVYVVLGLGVLAADTVFTAVLRAQVQAFRIPTESMAPTLAAGDLIYVDRTAFRRGPVRRGDVVAFAYPRDTSKMFVMRVLGLPGETIELRDRRVLVNGAPIEDSHAAPPEAPVRTGAYERRDAHGPIRLGPDQVYVLGDQRGRANDSRYFGPVGLGAIIGRASVVYYSWDAAAGAPRWSRIGRRIE